MSRTEATHVWGDIPAEHVLKQTYTFPAIDPYRFGEWTAEDGGGWYMPIPSDLRDTTWDTGQIYGGQATFLP